MNIRHLLLLRHSCSVPFVFTLGRSNDRLHTRRQTSIKITGLEARGNLLVNDPLANRVGQDAFQSVADLQKHFVILHENKKHRAVVFVLLTGHPRPGHAHGVIFHPMSPIAFFGKIATRI